jgi:hypothetical protein
MGFEPMRGLFARPMRLEQSEADLVEARTGRHFSAALMSRWQRSQQRQWLMRANDTCAARPSQDLSPHDQRFSWPTCQRRLAASCARRHGLIARTTAK